MAFIHEQLEKILNYVSGLDPVLAPVAFISLYVLATVLVIPGSIITLSAGVLFGAWWGSIYVSLASVIGASLAFLIGRYIARDFVSKKIESHPKFKSVDRAISREGAKIVFMLRLSPLFPFNILNYGLGITNIPFWKYVGASWLGMLPGTVLYVYIGSLFKNLADLAGGARDKTTVEWALYALGLLATIVVTIYITKIAKKAITETI